MIATAALLLALATHPTSLPTPNTAQVVSIDQMIANVEQYDIRHTAIVVKFSNGTAIEHIFGWECGTYLHPHVAVIPLRPSQKSRTFALSIGKLWGMGEKELNTEVELGDEYKKGLMLFQFPSPPHEDPAFHARLKSVFEHYRDRLGVRSVSIGWIQSCVEQERHVIFH